jgi:hypothetical protein
MICDILEQVLFEEAGTGVAQRSLEADPIAAEIRSR